ncbi:MAG TPA: SDR family oxidoreductase [Micromonosporaceae bacterium]
MRLLVVGASGHLGAEVSRRALAAGWTVAGTHYRTPGRGSATAGVDWHPLDVRDGAAVRKLLARVRPAAVVNAAYSYGDWAACADGAGHVATASAKVGARLVHISSDSVHGGRSEPYGDDEPPSPVFPYGAAKAAGETAVRVADPGAAVVRTSLIIGDDRSKQVRLCLDLITSRVPGALFSDEIRCPVAVDDLAAAVLELVDSDVSGLLNIAGPEAVSRPELGALVAGRYGLDPSRIRVSTTAEAGLVRPGEVRLHCARARALLKTRLRGVSEVLTDR